MEEHKDTDNLDDISQCAAGMITVPLAPAEAIALRYHLKSSVTLWTKMKHQIINKSALCYDA